MTGEIKVLRSLEMPGGERCVDLFVRPDGTFGFEEYRRDMEDRRGWFPIGFHGQRTFAGEDAALEAALAAVPWLKDAVHRRQ